MTGFLSRIFGGKKKEGGTPVEVTIRETFAGLIEKSAFELDFDLKSGNDERGEPQVVIECTGTDAEMLKDREGQMIDAIQLFLKRVLQHRFPEDRTNVIIDCDGFREESNQALVDLAEKLKSVALERGRPVYLRALAPKDRKVIHQHLASDERVKSRSIGDGLYKKIKIFPVRDNAGDNAQDEKSAE